MGLPHDAWDADAGRAPTIGGVEGAMSSGSRPRVIGEKLAPSPQQTEQLHCCSRLHPLAVGRIVDGSCALSG